MTIYGLFGFTHGWAKVLTLMSADGAGALRERIAAAGGGFLADLTIDTGPGRLVAYLEKRSGAHRKLVAAHGVVVLDKARWDAKKAELGDGILL